MRCHNRSIAAPLLAIALLTALAGCDDDVPPAAANAAAGGGPSPLAAAMGHAPDEVIVIASSGPSATRFAAGTHLSPDMAISLDAGDRIVIRHGGGTRALTGPGVFTFHPPLAGTQASQLRRRRAIVQPVPRPAPGVIKPVPPPTIEQPGVKPGAPTTSPPADDDGL